MAHDRSLPLADREELMVPRLVRRPRPRRVEKVTLFKEEGGRWYRVAPYAFPVEKAREVFKYQLMGAYLTGQTFALRVVREE